MKRAKPKADPELADLLKIQDAVVKLYFQAVDLYSQMEAAVLDYERCQAEKAKRAA